MVALPKGSDFGSFRKRPCHEPCIIVKLTLRRNGYGNMRADGSQVFQVDQVDAAIEAYLTLLLSRCSLHSKTRFFKLYSGAEERR